MNDHRVVLITGANFWNQGAYMMLRAAADACRDRLSAVPALDLRYGSERQKRAEGLDTAVLVEEFGPARSLGLNLLPRRVRDRMPVITARDIAGVIDVSGFAWGDQWAHARLSARAKRFKSFALAGKPVVLLPQAFGPFEETAHSAELVLRYSSLIFARDRLSLDYLSALSERVGGRAQISTAPDFTAPLPPIEPSRLDFDSSVLGRSVAIVPNVNIAARGSEKDYIRTLANLASEVSAAGLQPLGIIHDRSGDARLLDAAGIHTRIDGLNGLELKWVLSRVRAAVSGRYHASVSSLSAGVPTVIHGWSHKYEDLALLFGSPDLLVDPYMPTESREALTQSLADDTLRGRLERLSGEVSAQTDRMWDEVCAIFES